MSKLTSILILVLLYSCGPSKERPDPNTLSSNDSVGSAVTFSKLPGKAVLIGEKIQLLNEEFNVCKDISYLNEGIVLMTEVSDSSYKSSPSSDYCEEFKYVKIKTEEFDGYVDGRKVYMIIEKGQDAVLDVGRHRISLVKARNFGVGVSDKDGLTFCSINTPTIFIDKNVGYEGLVRMIKNENSDGDYKYFELKDDDMAYDEINSVERRNGGYLIKLKRYYQEGSANLLVSVYKDTTGLFWAEILDKKSIDE
nr:hypothetical protein [uncultured Flavobacterium sp.]